MVAAYPWSLGSFPVVEAPGLLCRGLSYSYLLCSAGCCGERDEGDVPHIY